MTRMIDYYVKLWTRDQDIINKLGRLYNLWNPQRWHDIFYENPFRSQNVNKHHLNDINILV